MNSYSLTEIFTLIPAEVYTPANGKEALREQFSLGEDFTYSEQPVEKHNAVMAYAGTTPPFALRLIEECNAITNYNRVVFHYSAEHNLSHTIICTAEELKLANSFKAESFESALYFLFLSIKQLQINPKQCVIRVCSDISPAQEEIITKFFNSVEKNNLNNFIQQ